jgi:hypothetical protein
VFRRRVTLNSPTLEILPWHRSDRTHSTVKKLNTQQPFDIDELSSSPWIGLQYRYEFLLHHSHQLLEQQPRV